MPFISAINGSVLRRKGSAIIEQIQEIKDWSTATLIADGIDNPNDYGTSADDRFGYAVGVSDSYVIAGAINEDDSFGDNNGKAYIFDRSTGNLLRTLDNPNLNTNTLSEDGFGWSVAISDTYAVVAAPREYSSNGYDSGVVYVFNPSTGSRLHSISNPNPYAANDWFGVVVAISGNNLIVGAERTNPDGQSNSQGQAYIYDLSTGSLLHTLSNPNPIADDAIGDNFGQSVAIDGNYAIVGSSEDEAVGSGSRSGKAYIFNVTTGALLHTLDNPNPIYTPDNDYFSEAVAISGNYAIVGGWGEDLSETSRTSKGIAYIFDVTTGNLVHTVESPYPYDSRFGATVAINDTHYAIGAGNAASSDYRPQSGVVLIYSLLDHSLVHTIENPNRYGTKDNDTFGGGGNTPQSMVMYNDCIVVGAYAEDDVGGLGSGKVYVFE